MEQKSVFKIVRLTNIILIVMVIKITYSSADPPTCEELLDVRCPISKPNLCKPYGKCCRAFEYCHQGVCESCFPRDVREADLFSWCKNEGRNNVSLMQDRSCGKACQYWLSERCQDPLDPCDCPSERHKKCPLGQCCRYDQYCDGHNCTSCFPENVTEAELHDLCRSSSFNGSCRFACPDSFFSSERSRTEEFNKWMYAFIGMSILYVVLFLAFILILYLYRKQRNRLAKRRNTNEKDAARPHENIPLNNTETQEPVVNRQLVRGLSLEENSNTELRTADTHETIEEISDSDDTIIINKQQ